MRILDIFPRVRREREALESTHCLNHADHVSAWPAFDRKPCPLCGKVYVRKEAVEKKE